MYDGCLETSVPLYSNWLVNLFLYSIAGIIFKNLTFLEKTQFFVPSIYFFVRSNLFFEITIYLFVPSIYFFDGTKRWNRVTKNALLITKTVKGSVERPWFNNTNGFIVINDFFYVF